MAKILDKMFNRVIEGEILEISDAEITKLGLAKASDIPSALKLYMHSITFKATSGSYIFVAKVLLPFSEHVEINNFDDFINQFPYVGLSELLDDEGFDIEGYLSLLKDATHNFLGWCRSGSAPIDLSYEFEQFSIDNYDVEDLSEWKPIEEAINNG